MPVSIIRVREQSLALAARAFAGTQLWKMSSPMSQEVRFRGLAQVLMAIFAINSWTSWLVRRVPVQIESLRIPKVMTALVMLTFLSWTGERLKCFVTHHTTCVENRVSLLMTRKVA